ncbi:MAG: hypothetical protein WA793_13955 [Sphingorhabdus sp.]|uniref:hypothetical protein n=1 Tax=Sphingorhabdus sp. TaxID=1902408 RepID=UPI003C80BC43
MTMLAAQVQRDGSLTMLSFMSSKKSTKPHLGYVGNFLSPQFLKVPILASSMSPICHPDRNDGQNPMSGIGVSFDNFDVGMRLGFPHKRGEFGSRD